MLDYKLIEALAMVSQEGGFEKAAERLCITQSAVSQRIKLLEAQAGQILLARRNPPRPTPSGQQMIKHYQHDLWLHRRKPFSACPETEWREGMTLDLGPDTGVLRLSGDAVPIPEGWLVRSREGDDRIRPMPNGPSRKIKHFYQSASIPPWLRPGIPILEWEGEPVALGDWVLGNRLQIWLVENNLEYSWQPGDPVLSRLRSDCQP